MDFHSDQRIAYQLMLAKVDATLHNSRKNRETLPQFESDWDILMRLSVSEGERRTTVKGL